MQQQPHRAEKSEAPQIDRGNGSPSASPVLSPASFAVADPFGDTKLPANSEENHAAPTSGSLRETRRAWKSLGTNTEVEEAMLKLSEMGRVLVLGGPWTSHYSEGGPSHFVIDFRDSMHTSLFPDRQGVNGFAQVLALTPGGIAILTNTSRDCHSDCDGLTRGATPRLEECNFYPRVTTLLTHVYVAVNSGVTIDSILQDVRAFNAANAEVKP